MTSLVRVNRTFVLVSQYCVAKTPSGVTREATGETSGGRGLSPRPDGGRGRGRREGPGEGAADGRPDSVPVPASGRHVQDGAAEGDRPTTEWCHRVRW